MNWKRTLLLVGVLCLAAMRPAAAADEVNMPAEIVFTNGIKKKVTLVAQDAETVKVMLSNGKTDVYKRDDIKSIEWQLPQSLQVGEELLTNGDYAKALTKYDETVAKESNAWCVERARFRRMQCCLVLGKYEDAVKEYIRILKADPKGDNYARLPLPLGESPENAKAVKYLRAIADIEKDNVVKGMALGLAASALAADKKCKEAEELIKSMLLISDPKAQGFAKVLYGQIAVEKEDYAGAIKLITQNLKDIPDALLPAAYFWLGKGYLGKDEYERAAIAFMRCPTYMQQNQEIAGDSLYFGAKAFEKADRWQEAARLYGYLVEGFPGARNIQEVKETLDKLRKIGRGG